MRTLICTPIQSPNSGDTRRPRSQIPAHLGERNRHQLQGTRPMAKKSKKVRKNVTRGIAYVKAT
ncbi:MAG: hypothetical protein AAF593_08880, partial [Planctomycetota bacterium]